MTKRRWCSSVDDECVCNGGWGGVGGGYWPSLLLANKDDVLRWMRKQRWCSSVEGWGGFLAFVVAYKQRWCSSVDDECVCKGGGGVIGVRCCLQTKMMFFGGWGNEDDVLLWMMIVFVTGGGGVGGVIGVRCCLQTKMMFFGGWGNKDDVLRWRGGGFLAFAFACKQRWRSSVDEETLGKKRGWRV